MKLIRRVEATFCSYVLPMAERSFPTALGLPPAV
jgi:hypothetical protein